MKKLERGMDIAFITLDISLAIYYYFVGQYVITLFWVILAFAEYCIKFRKRRRNT